MSEHVNNVKWRRCNPQFQSIEQKSKSIVNKHSTPQGANFTDFNEQVSMNIQPQGTRESNDMVVVSEIPWNRLNNPKENMEMIHF